MTNPFSDSPPPPALTVSQLNRQAKNLLETHFDFVWVEGEVSNFASPSSGHWYFSLKDGNAQVRCAMFRNRNQRIKFTPANGDAIRLRARVSLYEGRGEFQLIVEHLEHAGAGALQAAFEKLKTRLAAEGLFDQRLKQPLPEQVSRLGVITSPTGAAIHDILTVLKRRCPSIEVYILPVAVQGDGAAAEICAAIEQANHLQDAGKIHLDALIVGRGGGSLEDLWAFNEEPVARAIVASSLPIVSAVGHEIDFSIADMAADHRAPTPSAAAELLSPDQREWQERLRVLEAALHRQIKRKLADAARELDHLRKRLKHPGAQLREQAQRLDELEQRLLLAQRNSLQQKHAQLALLESRLHARSPLPQVMQHQSELERLYQRMNSAMKKRLSDASQQVSHLAQVLESLSPTATLKRGYAIVTDSQGHIVTDAQSQTTGNSVRARLANGSLDLEVAAIHANSPDSPDSPDSQDSEPDVNQ
ncbi:MAG: exodeoxyribonuclease VII large subunit [Halioglobus sp.]